MPRRTSIQEHPVESRTEADDFDTSVSSTRTLTQYEFSIQDYKSSCATQEVQNNDAYTLLNKANFQLEVASSDLFNENSVTTNLHDTFIVKYDAQINCEYQLAYEVNLDLAYDKDIRTKEEVDGFSKDGTYSVDMQVYSDETFENKFDISETDYDEPSFTVGETVHIAAKLQEVLEKYNFWQKTEFLTKKPNFWPKNRIFDKKTNFS